MGRLQTLRPRLGSMPAKVQPAPQGEAWRAGKTTNQRGYDYRWQKARKQYLAEHPLCVMCEHKGITTAANTVDHIVPHRGDQRLFWDESNWQALCAPCHSGEKQKQEAR